MLKKILNETKITFHIKATGPILIKKGENDDNIMRFVRDSNNKIFIPGSSIKGVWRSWCEKIARTLSEDAFPISCDPFKKDKSSCHISCSDRLEKKDSKIVYAQSCPICKLFGNNSLGSRIRIGDAYLINNKNIPEGELHLRDGIGIDRFTGGVSNGANFQYEYLLDKIFVTEINIRNFELWQLGLLSYLLRDFNEELVPIGFGKTRGLGKVKGEVASLVITYYGLVKPSVDTQNKKAEILGIGNLYNESDKAIYSFASEQGLKDIEFTGCINNNPIKISLTFDNGNAGILFNNLAPYWAGIDGKNPKGYFLEAQKLRKEILSKIEDKDNNNGDENV